MRVFGRTNGSVAARAVAIGTLAGLLLAALSLSGLLFVGSAAAGWPNVPSAQPLVQAPRVCASNIVPLNRRCRVIDFTSLGEIQGRKWYYAFYATHWADRHGRMDRGFPVFFYLQRPATLRLDMWVRDAPGLAGQWARTPPARPILIRRPEAIYLGLTLKAVRGQDDQRLLRLDDKHWKPVSIFGARSNYVAAALTPSEDRSPEDRVILDAAIPKPCQAVDDGDYDWARFRLVMALMTRAGHRPCGTLIAGLQVRKNRVYLTDAVVQPPANPLLFAHRP